MKPHCLHCSTIEAVVDKRAQLTERRVESLETELAATRETMETKIDTLTKMLQTLIDKEQS